MLVSEIGLLTADRDDASSLDLWLKDVKKHEQTPSF